MSVQSQSTRLEGAALQREQRKESFTLKEAALYWAGYLSIAKGDLAARAEFEQIYSMLEAAAKSGDLEGVTPTKKTKTMNAGGFVTRWDDESRQVSTTVDVWRAAVATRDALVSYAESVHEHPLFLFPESFTRADDVPQESASVGRRDIQGYIITAVIAALQYDPKAIPPNGKAEIKKACLAVPQYFTDAGFNHCWKSLSSDGKVCMAERDKFKSKSKSK